MAAAGQRTLLQPVTAAFHICKTAAAHLAWTLHQGLQALLRIRQVNKQVNWNPIQREQRTGVVGGNNTGVEFSSWVRGGWLPAPVGSFAEMGALVGDHASDTPSSGTGYTPAHNSIVAH